MNGLAHVAVPPITGPALDNKRVAAALIDLLVLFVVAFLLGALAGGYSPGAAAVTTAWALYYYFALESLTGQTLGKKLMGLRVAQTDGGPPEMRQIAVRTVLRLVDGVGIYLVGLIVMLVSGERRQRLGDLAAGTIVTAVEQDRRDAPVVARNQDDDPLPQAPERAPAPMEEPVGFEPYRVPEPLPPAAEEPRIELVPDPPPEGERPRIQIVSPMDVVMGEDGQDERPPPPQPA